MAVESSSPRMAPAGIEAALAGIKEKSILLSLLLALLAGPVGLLYASVSAGTTMCIATAVIGGMVLFFGSKATFIIFGGLIWLVCVIWAYNASRRTIRSTFRSLKFRNGESLFFKSLIIFLAFIVALPLVVILLYIIKQGVVQVNWTFLTHIPKPVGELGGGIANALVGSIIIVTMASVIAIPIGVLCGIYLSENPNTKLAYYSGLCVDVLQGVPSIVTGIVVYFWMVKSLGFSAISGSIALAIMMLPIVVRATEQTLRLLPDSLKEAALSLGVPYHRVMLKVIIPCGFAGILSGIILSIARIIGETAPLLFTALGSSLFYVALNKPMETLPHLIFTYATSPYDDWHNLAWGASFILLMFVLLLNIFTKLITRKWNIQL
jgi:phosphate transport system permease protein